MIDSIIGFLIGLPPAAIYAVIAVGAAIENVIPPIPADTFVLLGAFLAGSGRLSVWLVFLSTWLANVASAMTVYALARRWGRHIFETGIGRRLLKPRQLEKVSRFYDRWGTPAILVSRFLPAFRAIVPVFAGISNLNAIRVLIPLATASAAWYGALIVIGRTAGRNWSAIAALFDRISTVLLVIAAVLVILVGAWWWRTRRETA
jgi:membrane protein DedA with SNARE-associated domain